MILSLNVTRFFALVSLLRGFALPAYAQLDQAYFNRLHTREIPASDLVRWQQVGPGMSGYCEEFWAHPTEADVLMMSPDMFNTYGSWDGGKSWTTVKHTAGSGRDLPRIRKFAFSHQNPAFGLAIAGGGKLYQTADKGKSWSLVRSFKGRFADLVVAPSDDKVWFLAPGEFWNVKKTHRHQQGQSREVANEGIFRSLDGGKVWEQVNIGEFTDLDVGRIIVDPTDAKVVVAITNHGVFRSTDQGRSWKASAKGLPVNRPRDMDYFFNAKTGEFILYLIEQTAFEKAMKAVKVRGGVYKSTDHGKSWVNITGNLGIDLNKISSQTIRNKYWQSLAFWFQMDVKAVKETFPDLPRSVFSIFHRIQVNPLNKNEIYLSHNSKHDKAFLPGGAWKTTDGGKSWIACARAGKYWLRGDDDAYWKSRHNPVGVNTKFAHLQPEMNRREEGWGNRFLEIDQKGRVYICLEQQVMQSLDGGHSWQQ
ncbi:MAG: hypothetical protein AAFV07_12100, partial [Bacteroidota bacterium]